MAPDESAALRLTGPARRLTIFVGESDQHRHHPVYAEIVQRAHDAGLAGATVLRGIEGFGASSRIHTAHLLRLSQDLPVTIVLVDERERIDAFLPRLDELVSEGMVLIDDVEVIRYVGRQS